MPAEVPNPNCQPLVCADSVLCSASDFDLKIYPEVVGPTHLVWDAAKAVARNEMVAPIEARIEYARAGVKQVDAWKEVRDYGENAGMYTDQVQRQFGVSSNTHYRVLLRDSLGAIISSEPVRAFGTLTARFYGVYREVVRRWHLRGRNGELRRGYLLKRTRYGDVCTSCIDRDSGVQVSSQCLECYGVGRLPGYWQAPQCSYAEFSPVAEGEHFDGTINQRDDGRKATIKILNLPQIYSGDVWVEADTDHRWLFGDIAHVQTIGSFELLASVQAARLDFTHIAYRVPIQE